MEEQYNTRALSGTPPRQMQKEETRCADSGDTPIFIETKSTYPQRKVAENPWVVRQKKQTYSKRRWLGDPCRRLQHMGPTLGSYTADAKETVLADRELG